MHEELALRHPSDLASQWGDPDELADVPTLTRVPEASVLRARGLATDTPGEVTAEAYQRHASEIHGFLLRIVRDPEAAADLVADAFTKLLTEERAGRTPLQVRAWLYRVAANLATSRGRRIQAALRRSLRLERQSSREHAPSAERAVLDREREGDLWRALGTVSPEERTALLLAAQGYDGASIATIIGRSHVATRTMLCRVRRRL